MNNMITQGTISVLLGCHSLMHSVLVTVAWCRLYRRPPLLWQFVCIILHDIGHWGKQYLDDYEAKKEHAVLGAKIANRLFGRKGYDLIAGHNCYNGQPRSDLYMPDKLSWTIAPLWWLILTNIFEPKLVRSGLSLRQSAVVWKEAMRENCRTGANIQGHDIYMAQCKEKR